MSRTSERIQKASIINTIIKLTIISILNIIIAEDVLEKDREQRQQKLKKCFTDENMEDTKWSCDFVRNTLKILHSDPGRTTKQWSSS